MTASILQAGDYAELVYEPQNLRFENKQRGDVTTHIAVPIELGDRDFYKGPLLSLVPRGAITAAMREARLTREAAQALLDALDDGPREECDNRERIEDAKGLLRHALTGR